MGSNPAGGTIRLALRARSPFDPELTVEGWQANYGGQAEPTPGRSLSEVKTKAGGCRPVRRSTQREVGFDPCLPAVAREGWQTN